MITYTNGDATVPQVNDGIRLIIHICNDIGAWGRGFVLAISKKWSAPEMEYKNWAKENNEESPFKLGQTQFVQVEPTIIIANMIAQKGLRKFAGERVVQYDALESCLNIVATKCLDLTSPISIHAPRIGTGLGGGNWNDIELILTRTLKDIPVFIYDFTG